VGPVVAQHINRFFSEAHNQAVIEQLLNQGKVQVLQQLVATRSNGLAGKVFVVTGTLNSMTRDEAKAAIKQSGGKVTGGVSAKTDFLVYGDKPGSKLDKARSLEIELLDEAAFIELLSRN